MTGLAGIIAGNKRKDLYEERLLKRQQAAKAAKAAEAAEAATTREIGRAHV